MAIVFTIIFCSEKHNLIARTHAAANMQQFVSFVLKMAVGRPPSWIFEILIFQMCRASTLSHKISLNYLILSMRYGNLLICNMAAIMQPCWILTILILQI